MAALLEMKERLIRFYGKHEFWLKPIARFLIALAIFMCINQNIGYMSRISQTPIALILALVCALAPVGLTVFLTSVVILLNMYALSLEVCLVTLILILIIYFLYFRFAPKNGYDMVLTPLCFQCGIPYVMPLAMGLLRGWYSVFSLIAGTVLYFFLHGVHENAAVLSSAAEVEEGAASKFVIVINQLVDNREMYLVMGIFVLTTVIVYIIRRMAIENAWVIAIISGVLFETIGLIAGYILLEIPDKMVWVLVGNLISVLIAFVLQFFFFNLDYSRTERLQFEDDEYYYYVKAVPKAIVSGMDKKVKRFGSREEHLTKQKFAEEMGIDEELLD